MSGCILRPPSTVNHISRGPSIAILRYCESRHNRHVLEVGFGPRRPFHPRSCDCELSPSPQSGARSPKHASARLTAGPGYSSKGKPLPPPGALRPASGDVAERCAQFKKLLTPGKIGQVLCLGNLTSPSVYNFLRALAPDLQLVKGDFDLPLTTAAPSPSVAHQPGAGPVEPTGFPIPTALSKVVTHGSLRIGFTHGDTIVPPGDQDALLIAARQMDVDVLCWGGTCRFEAYEMEGKFFINPGSATGAVSWFDETLPGSTEEEHNTPSFVLMDVQGDVLVLYIYQLRTDADGNENVAVEKVSFRKNNPSI